MQSCGMCHRVDVLADVSEEYSAFQLWVENMRKFDVKTFFGKQSFGLCLRVHLMLADVS
jgi:hypothetical protein